MPEGDTIHKVCAALEAELTGAPVRDIHLRRLDAGPLRGRHILRLWSKGKHLFIAFDNRLVLRSHLGLYGSWHRYAPGERWRKPERQASVVIDTGQRVLVCFNAKEVELLAADGFPLADAQQRLGPDLIRNRPADALVVARARDLLAPGTPLADVLLDQRIASGIGNVYKCELLFLGRLHPMLALCETPDAALAGLYARAADLLGRNLGGGTRTTRFERDGRGHLWVYGRAGEPCLRCAVPVRRDRFGVNPRSTYWCPGCQPEPGWRPVGDRGAGASGRSPGTGRSD